MAEFSTTMAVRRAMVWQPRCAVSIGTGNRLKPRAPWIAGYRRLFEACRHCCSPRRRMSPQATCRGGQGRLPRIPRWPPPARARPCKAVASLAQFRARSVRSPRPSVRPLKPPWRRVVASFALTFMSPSVWMWRRGGDFGPSEPPPPPASRARARRQGSWRCRSRPPAVQAPCTSAHAVHPPGAVGSLETSCL